MSKTLTVPSTPLTTVPVPSKRNERTRSVERVTPSAGFPARLLIELSAVLVPPASPWPAIFARHSLDLMKQERKPYICMPAGDVPQRVLHACQTLTGDDRSAQRFRS
ncbi:hypothetical protein [Actinoplanes sichuanensis]|uniref:Uncharacterized protein n=1 Tax=Actinoplanes sichuanensis TaxID=512349 RepID=A0ABW4APH6_9ACTN|nr:hypothetical protein [Actinoplanes sichuanensis]